MWLTLKNDPYWQLYREFKKDVRFGMLSMTVRISGASTTLFFRSTLSSVITDVTTL